MKGFLKTMAVGACISVPLLIGLSYRPLETALASIWIGLTWCLGRLIRMFSDKDFR